jgi:hypothetical protein
MPEEMGRTAWSSTSPSGAPGHCGHLSAYLAYVVASPRPLDTECRTVEQMKLANALWRFAEVAESG